MGLRICAEAHFLLRYTSPPSSSGLGRGCRWSWPPFDWLKPALQLA